MIAILRTGLLAGLATCAPVTSAAAAEAGLTVPTRVEVPVADLDLRNPADIVRLERRMALAVSRACPVERGHLRIAHRCRTDGSRAGRGQMERAIAAAGGSEPSLLASR